MSKKKNSRLDKQKFRIVQSNWGLWGFKGARFCPQDPNEDTEWNDILRRKGVLPPKEIIKDEEEEAALAREQQSIGMATRMLTVVQFVFVKMSC